MARFREEISTPFSLTALESVHSFSSLTSTLLRGSTWILFLSRFGYPESRELQV
jgi:hypothetical protein